MDKKTKKQQLQEFDPVSMAVGVGAALIYLAIQLAMIFAMFTTMIKRIKIDPVRTKKLNSVLKDGKKWTVHVMKEPVPNAFCMIKPHVFLTTGLIKLLNEEELMAVMLHEAGHINNKDLWKDVIGSNMLITILAGAAGAIGGPPGLTIISFILICLGGMDLIQLIFRRTLGRFAEKRADSFAVKYGYADAMISTLKKLDKYMKKELERRKCGPMCKIINSINEKLDEHPPVKERIENVLKSKETWEKTTKMSFVNARNFFMKKFGVDNPK